MGRIVVGVDGSDGSRRALQWAASEASLRGATLDAIHAYEPAQNLGSVGSATKAQRLITAAGEAARELVACMVIGIEGAKTTGRAVESLNPGRTLVEHSKGAELLVLSCGGRGRIRGLLRGSISRQCAHHAECPVVIIR